MFIFSSEEQASEGRVPTNKAVPLPKLEGLERKHFYICHEQGGCDYNSQRKDTYIFGYEPPEGLNVKTERLPLAECLVF